MSSKPYLSARGRWALIAIGLGLIAMGLLFWWVLGQGRAGGPSPRGERWADLTEEQGTGETGGVLLRGIGQDAASLEAYVPPARTEVGGSQTRLREDALVLQMVDSISSQPLSGAKIARRGGGEGRVWAADEFGRVELPLNEGALIASHEGYLQVHLDARDLRADARHALGGVVRVELPPVGELLVRVRGSEGEPIEGAYINILITSGHPSARRWNESLRLLAPPGTIARHEAGMERGRALGLEPTPLDPRIEEAGTDQRGEYLGSPFPKGVPLMVIVGEPVNITSAVATIPPQEQRGEIEIVVDRGFVLSGRVTLNDHPFPGVVEIKPWRGVERTAAAQGDGRFVLEGVPAGWTRLQVLWPEAEVIDFLVEGDMDLGDIALVRFQMSRGRLISRDPFRPNAVFVRSVRSASARQSPHAAEADGSFTLDGTEGPTRLLVSTATSSLPSQLFLGVDVELPLNGFEMDVDPHLAALEIVLPPDTEVQRTLSAELSIAPVFTADSSQTRRPGPSGPKHLVHFDERGEVRLPHLAPGTYDIGLVLEGGDAFFWPRTGFEAGGTVRLNAIDGVHAGLTGRVLDAPVSDALGTTVRLSPSLGDQVSTLLDSAGGFRFSGLLPGLHAVEVLGPGGRVLAIQSLELEAGEQHLDIAIQETASLSGIWDLPPVAGQAPSMHLRSLETQGTSALRRTGEVDPEGRFSFEDLPPGRYTLLAAIGHSADRYHIREELELAPGENREVVIQAPLGHGIVELNLPIHLGWMPGTAELLAGSSSKRQSARVHSLGEGRYRAPASDGPAVLLVAVPSAGYQNHPVYGGMGQHLVAMLPDGVPAGATLAVSLEGPSLEIQFENDRPDALLPIVRAIEVGGLPVSELSNRWTLAVVERGPRWVRFAPLPRGARVLINDPMAGQAHESEELVMTDPVRLRRP